MGTAMKLSGYRRGLTVSYTAKVQEANSNLPGGTALKRMGSNGGGGFSAAAARALSTMSLKACLCLSRSDSSSAKMAARSACSAYRTCSQRHCLSLLACFYVVQADITEGLPARLMLSSRKILCKVAALAVCAQLAGQVTVQVFSTCSACEGPAAPCARQCLL